jgi:hypothetical protein
MVGDGVGEGVGVEVLVGRAVGVTVGSSDVRSGTSLRPVSTDAADTPSKMTKANTRTKATWMMSSTKRGDDRVGGTREEYLSDPKVSRRIGPRSVLAPAITMLAIVLTVIVILAQPDARRAAPIWSDGFDRVYGDWIVDNGSIANGRLIVQSPALGVPARATHSLPIGNFVAETRARVVTGSTDNGYGIVVGKAGELVAFLISGDGYFSVMRRTGEQWIEVQSWKQWPHVRRGSALNTLRLKCDGRLCAFFVNDEITIRSDVQEGRDTMGLIVWRYAGGELSVEFESMDVWAASRGSP